MRRFWRAAVALLLLGAALAGRADTVRAVPEWQLAIGDYDAALGGRYGLIVEWPGLGGNYGEMYDVVLADLGDLSAPVAGWITAMPGRGYTFAPIDFLGAESNLFHTSVGTGDIYNAPSPDCGPTCLPAGVTFPASTLLPPSTLQITLLTSTVPEPASVALALAGLLAVAASRRPAHALQKDEVNSSCN